VAPPRPRAGLGCAWGIEAGRGRKPEYDSARIAQLVETTLQTKPTDVVGVYLTPPQNAVVLCVDEKSQIQALDRTQPGLPLKPGRCVSTFTHDYVRRGTTTLFAALHVVEGRVIGQCYQRHRHQEFLQFLRKLDTEFPGGKTLHLILDNYGTHGHASVRRWLARHPRFVLHFIPTSSSWLNLIERWFAELSQKAVRRRRLPHNGRPLLSCCASQRFDAVLTDFMARAKATFQAHPHGSVTPAATASDCIRHRRGSSLTLGGCRRPSGRSFAT